jgi:trans-aconitate methyltransferase
MESQGLSPKKQHEVTRFAHFLANHVHDNDVLVDVGSGAGHLERVLSRTLPKSVQMICIESSKSHVQSAGKWSSDNDKCQTIVARLEDSSTCRGALEANLPETRGSISIQNFQK